MTDQVDERRERLISIVEIARGRRVWYSSLMLDVARLVRSGHMDSARTVHAEATKLAQHRAAHFIAEWLAEHDTQEPAIATLDADTGGALRRLALLTMSARAALQNRLGVETFTGKTGATVGHGLIEVRDEHGRSVAIPIDPADSHGNHLVTVDLEPLSTGSAAVWVRRAFTADKDPNERVPADPQLLASEPATSTP